MTPMTSAAHAFAALVLAFSATACQPEQVAQARPSPTASSSSQKTEVASPAGHYCNMGVFTPAERARLEALVPRAVAAASEKREVSDGYAFKLSGEFREAGEWVDGVRRCCPTLHYQIEFEPHGGAAWVRITGGPGAKAFIEEEFGPLFKKTG